MHATCLVKCMKHVSIRHMSREVHETCLNQTHVSIRCHMSKTRDTCPNHMTHASHRWHMSERDDIHPCQKEMTYIHLSYLYTCTNRCSIHICYDFFTNIYKCMCEYGCIVCVQHTNIIIPKPHLRVPGSMFHTTDM